jgi:hypothetical protein
MGEFPGAHMTFQTAIDCLNDDTSMDQATKAQHIRTCTQHQQETRAAARQNTNLRDIAFIAVQDSKADYQSCKRTVHAAFLTLANAQMKAVNRAFATPLVLGGKVASNLRLLMMYDHLFHLSTLVRELTVGLDS